MDGHMNVVSELSTVFLTPSRFFLDGSFAGRMSAYAFMEKRSGLGTDAAAAAAAAAEEEEEEEEEEKLPLLLLAAAGLEITSSIRLSVRFVTHRVVAFVMAWSALEQCTTQSSTVRSATSAAVMPGNIRFVDESTSMERS